MSFAVQVTLKVPLEPRLYITALSEKVEIRVGEFEVLDRTVSVEGSCQEMSLVEIKLASMRANI